MSELTTPKPPPCSSIPVWAQARDAGYVLAVEALSTKIVEVHDDYGDYRREVAKVRVLDSLKDTAPWLSGTIVNTNDVYWERNALQSSEAERLVPGRRYIVFAFGDNDTRQFINKDTPISFELCGVREDTPEIRSELVKGFAQNDTLRP